MTLLDTILAVSASYIAYLVGRKRGEHVGWWRGFTANKHAYDRGLDRGWNEHRQFLERGGKDMPLQN